MTINLNTIKKYFKDFGFLGRGNQSFGLIGEDRFGNILYKHFRSKVCLANLSSVNINDYHGTFYFIDSIDKREDISNSLSLEYYKYVYNHPHFKGIFYRNQTAEIAYKRGYAIIKSSTPSNLLAMFVTMRRAIWEFPRFGKSWFRLKEGGFKEDIAYVLSHYVKVQENGFVMEQDLHNYNHTLFQKGSNLKTLKPFLGSLWKDHYNPPLEQSPKYRKIYELIGGAGQPFEPRENSINRICRRIIQTGSREQRTYRFIFTNTRPIAQRALAVKDFYNQFNKVLEEIV